jgi:hypothetical protein
VLWRFRGCQSWSERGKTTRRTRRRGCGHETKIREGGTAEEKLRAGRGNSGEEFWPPREAISCDRARASSSRGGGALCAKAGALDGVGLAVHCAGAASKRGRTLARPNWLKAGANRVKQAWGRVSHLRAELGVAWRGLRRAR